jgi:hypothetical protein
MGTMRVQAKGAWLLCRAVSNRDIGRVGLPSGGPRRASLRFVYVVSIIARTAATLKFRNARNVADREIVFERCPVSLVTTWLPSQHSDRHGECMICPAGPSYGACT